jgi:putative transposase
MPRANRCFLSGYVWHITHRCHKDEFLLKFGRDQRRWLQWVFEAKKRKGAFREDRYHTTAVEGGLHLSRCMVYVDLNMVRAAFGNSMGKRLLRYLNW